MCYKLFPKGSASAKCSGDGESKGSVQRTASISDAGVA
jgi:hypothetical protein